LGDRGIQGVALLLQDNWVSGMQPLAQWLVICGDEAAKVVERMESVARKVTPYTFKPLEQVVVPADWQELARAMLDDGAKATAQRLRDQATAVLRRRWWTWILLHPKAPEDDIHPTRRVCLASHCPLSTCASTHCPFSPLLCAPPGTMVGSMHRGPLVYVLGDPGLPRGLGQ
jgi:hypothetical protein